MLQFMCPPVGGELEGPGRVGIQFTEGMQDLEGEWDCRRLGSGVSGDPT